MSLGSWFRDYVYIPLGGNRVSTIKWLRNIMVVWMLTGLWHGASWNFVIWGVGFGILLVLEKVFLSKYLEKLPKFISRLYVMFIVMISFIIFSGENVTQIISNISGLFGVNNIQITTAESIYYLKSYLIIIILGIIGSTPILKNIVTSKKIEKISNIIEPVFLIVVLVVCVAYTVDGSFNPFLYFRF